LFVTPRTGATMTNIRCTPGRHSRTDGGLTADATGVTSAVGLPPPVGTKEASVLRQQSTPLDGSLERVPACQGQPAVVLRALELPPGLRQQSSIRASEVLHASKEAQRLPAKPCSRPRKQCIDNLAARRGRRLTSAQWS